MLLFEVPNIIKIFYEKENELIIHEWLEYNPEDQDNVILDIFQKIYDLFLTYPVEKVIVKADQTKGIFSLKAQEYIKEIQFPRLLESTNIRFVVTIKSRDEMKKIGALLWQKQFQEGAKVILHDVNNEHEARQWLEAMDSL